MTCTVSAALRRLDETVKLDWHSESATLREKRDRVLNRLRQAAVPFESFNQGSYELQTGINPPSRDYDIDVGLILTSPQVSSLSPIQAKQIVWDAVRGHTAQVEWRRNCIRVQYQDGGVPIYHVDLAIYRKDYGGSLALASGKQHSADSTWIRSEASGLARVIEDRYSGESLARFRRVVRLLKYWAAVNFSSQGNAMPVGIGLTVSAWEYLRYTGATATDAECLQVVVERMQHAFVWARGPDGMMGTRIVAPVPVLPLDDAYRRMTNQQMIEFRSRLARLAGSLAAARSQQFVVPLQSEFGQALR